MVANDEWNGYIANKDWPIYGPSKVGYTVYKLFTIFFLTKHANDNCGKLDMQVQSDHVKSKVI